MSFKAAAWAIETTKTQTANQKLVLIVLADCHNADTGRCDPSIEFIAERCHLSRRSVERSITQLESLGLIQKKVRALASGFKISSAYSLMISHASESRMHASESRIQEPDEPPQNQLTDPIPADATESRMHSGACVTESLSDASQSRINQEEENQEKNRERQTGKIPPENFVPDPFDLKTLRGRRPDLDLDAVVEIFKNTEFPYAKSDWRRAFYKFALTQRVNDRKATLGAPPRTERHML